MINTWMKTSCDNSESPPKLINVYKKGQYLLLCGHKLKVENTRFYHYTHSCGGKCTMILWKSIDCLRDREVVFLICVLVFLLVK